MEYLAVCRICLHKDVHHVVKNPQLQETYETLTTIPFQSDMRPLGLCYICYGQLRASHRFKLKCLQAEQLLAQMLDRLAEDEVLDASRIDLSTLNQMSFSATELTIICSDIQDDDEEKVEILYRDCVGLCKQSNEETTFSIDIKPDSRVQGDDIPIDNIKQNRGTAREQKKGTVRTTRSISRLKKAAPIARKSKPKPDPDIVKTEASQQNRDDDIKNPILNGISKSNRNLVKIEHDIYQQTNVNVDSKFGLRKYFICDVCERGFNRKCNLKTHILKYHIDNKPFVCDVCPKSYTHVRKHTCAKPNVCDVCDKSFPEKYRLKRHQRKHSSGAFSCNVCNKNFTSQFDLNRHASIHTSERSFICHVCGKGFTLRSYLMRHVLIHMDKRPRPYVCNVCNKGFTTKQFLNVHSRKHTGIRPFVCTVCSRAFAQSCALLKHSRIHTDERPYVCNVCGKGFRASNHLKIHSRSHSGERPYVCNACGKGFTTRGNLTVHSRLHIAEKVSVD